MKRLAVVLLLTVACSSGQGGPVPSATPRLTGATLDGPVLVGTLTGGGTVRAGASGATGIPVVNPAGTAVLVPVGAGATTTLYGVWALDAGRLVRVAAPAGQPGAGQPWQIPVGASVVTASGLRCAGPHLDLLHADSGAVTVSSYEISGGEAHAVSPAPAPPADQVGSLDC